MDFPPIPKPTEANRDTFYNFFIEMKRRSGISSLEDVLKYPTIRVTSDHEDITLCSFEMERKGYVASIFLDFLHEHHAELGVMTFYKDGSAILKGPVGEDIPLGKSMDDTPTMREFTDWSEAFYAIYGEVQKLINGIVECASSVRLPTMPE